MAKKKAIAERQKEPVVPVLPGDIIEPDFYNGLRTTLYPVIKPCVVKDIRHDGWEWTTFLVDTIAGERWINHRYFNYNK